MGLFSNIAKAVNKTANQVRQTVQHTAQQAQKTVQNTVHQAQQTVQHKVDSFEHKAQNTAHQVQQTVQHTAQQARQTVQNTVHQAQQTVQNTVHQVQHTAQQARQTVQHTVDNFEHKAQHTAQQAQHTVQNVVQQAQHAVQNTVHHVEQAAAHTVQQAQQAAQHTVQQAQQAVQNTVHQVEHAAQTVQNTVHQVEQAAQHTVQQAQQAVQNTVHQVEQVVQHTAQQAQQVVSQVEQKASEIIEQVKNSDIGKAAKPVVDLAVATAESVAQEVGLVPTPAEPLIMREDRGTGSYGQVPGQLFVDGANRDDIQQGGTGDCYFLSTLSSIANSHPDVIENAIKDNGNGTYTVTFQVPVGFEAFSALGPAGGLMVEGAYDQMAKLGLNLPTRPVQVTVDGSLPLKDSGNLRYSQNPNGENWVPIIEKAYAQLWGGYGDIGTGGNPSTAMRLLTGGNVETHTLANPINNNPLGVKVIPVNPSEARQQAVFNDLKTALDNKKIVVAGSYGADMVQGQQGLVSGHAYSVVDTVEEGGKQYVVLRNPWGHQETGSDGKDDGVFRMPVEDFIKNFASYDVGSVP